MMIRELSTNAICTRFEVELDGCPPVVVRVYVLPGGQLALTDDNSANMRRSWTREDKYARRKWLGNHYEGQSLTPEGTFRGPRYTDLPGGSRTLTWYAQKLLEPAQVAIPVIPEYSYLV